MLHHVNKLYCLLLIVIIAGCHREPSSDELRQKREEALQISISTIGQDEYWKVYNAMNDSVKVWAENELWFYKYFNRDSIDYGVEYQIDSLLCFNTQKNMCLTGILRQSTSQDTQMDGIWHFFGIKIDDQWYFSDGAALILPRESYQKEIHTPLSFEKLKELAMKHLYINYLRKGKDGKMEINEAFFDYYNKYDAYSNPVTTEAERDSSWIKACKDNWKQKNKR